MAESDITIPSVRHFTENSFLEDGFAKSDRFIVRFEDIGKIVGGSGAKLDTNLFSVNGWLSSNVVSVDVPGFAISVEDAPHRHKVTQRNPSEDVSITFYDSKDWIIRRQMYKWINFICEDEIDAINYTRNYFDDFVVNMRVWTITDSGKLVPKKETDYFTGIYPLSVGNVDFNISTENELGTTQVQFKYRRHLIQEGVVEKAG